MAAQRAAFAANPQLQRDADYFRDRIAGVKNAGELIEDRRLLGIALGAFGLEGDIGNRAFVRRILEDGTLRPDALGNRLADKRYLEFSRAFGFGDFPVANTQKSDFADRILAAYEARRFEKAVGVKSDDLRLALNAQRELGQIADRSLSVDGKWFSVLGSPPLRTVFQKALGLPASIAAIDIDQQLGIFKERAARVIGSSDPGVFSDQAQVEKLIRRFLLASDASASAPNAAVLGLFRAGTRQGGLLSRLV